MRFTLTYVAIFFVSLQIVDLISADYNPHLKQHKAEENDFKPRNKHEPTQHRRGEINRPEMEKRALPVGPPHRENLEFAGPRRHNMPRKVMGVHRKTEVMNQGERMIHRPVGTYDFEDQPDGPKSMPRDQPSFQRPQDHDEVLEFMINQGDERSRAKYEFDGNELQEKVPIRKSTMKRKPEDHKQTRGEELMKKRTHSSDENKLKVSKHKSVGHGKNHEKSTKKTMKNDHVVHKVSNKQKMNHRERHFKKEEPESEPMLAAASLTINAPKPEFEVPKKEGGKDSAKSQKKTIQSVSLTENAAANNAADEFSDEPHPMEISSMGSKELDAEYAKSKAFGLMTAPSSFKPICKPRKMHIFSQSQIKCACHFKCHYECSQEHHEGKEGGPNSKTPHEKQQEQPDGPRVCRRVCTQQVCKRPEFHHIYTYKLQDGSCKKWRVCSFQARCDGARHRWINYHPMSCHYATPTKPLLHHKLESIKGASKKTKEKSILEKASLLLAKNTHSEDKQKQKHEQDKKTKETSMIENETRKDRHFINQMHNRHAYREAYSSQPAPKSSPVYTHSQRHYSRAPLNYLTDTVTGYDYEQPPRSHYGYTSRYSPISQSNWISPARSMVYLRPELSFADDEFTVAKSLGHDWDTEVKAD